MNNRLIQEAFGVKGWIRLSKRLVKELGLEAALMIGLLVDKDSYWTAHKKKYRQLTGRKYDGEFFMTRDNACEVIGLSAHKQREAEKVLLQKRIITVTVKGGINSKNHYRIDYDQLEWYLTGDDFSEDEEEDEWEE